MAAAAAPAVRRRLSELPDELLLRILSFLPSKDAAATAVLSRRWRSLRLASGVVYLDSRSLAPSSWKSERNSNNYSFHDSRRRTTQAEESEEFLRAAAEALAAAAAAAPITRLIFLAKLDSLICRPDVVSDGRDDLLAAVLSDPAARRVEELHIEVEVEQWNGLPLRFASLPSDSLRLLRAVKCSPVAVPPPHAAFPRLAELNLHDCGVPLAELQPIVAAAPQLATLRLESCDITEKQEDFHTPPPAGTAAQAQAYRLACPAVTALVFDRCNFESSGFRLEIDAPRLESFTYMGDLQLCDCLSLNPNPTGPMGGVIRVVDLQLTDDEHNHNTFMGEGGNDLPASFWRFIGNFRTAKVLKLKLYFSMDRVALEAPSQGGEIMLDYGGASTTTKFRNLDGGAGEVAPRLPCGP
ncbi:unnamed protein product [Urochloa humidicola]